MATSFELSENESQMVIYDQPYGKNLVKFGPIDLEIILLKGLSLNKKYVLWNMVSAP